MQTQAKFCLCFNKVNPGLFLCSILQLPILDELLSIPKITTFLAKSLPQLHEPAPSNAIP